MSLYVRIKKRLGNFNMDLEFSSGDETVALLGESGSGKSMTLKCIAGIEKPDEGRIVLNDRVLFDSEKRIDLPPRKRNVGILFQNYALFPNMTVERNISAGMKKLSEEEKKRRVANMISMFSLEGLEKKHPSQLSGGQQQRVATARMLGAEPDIIMLDEPFSALDSHLRWKLEMQLTDDLAKFKGTVILVSHNRDEAYRMSNRIIVIKDGRCTAPMDKEQMFGDPHTVAAAIVSGCKNIVPAVKIDGHRIKIPTWNAVLDTDSYVPDDLVSVGIRSHTIRDSGSCNEMACTVERVIESPFEYSVVMSVDSSGTSKKDEQHSIFWQINGAEPEQIPSVGDRVSVFIPKEKILLLV